MFKNAAKYIGQLFLQACLQELGRRAGEAIGESLKRRLEQKRSAKTEEAMKSMCEIISKPPKS